MLKEFKDFIMTGNVIDLAVAVILAAAVGGVVSGFTNDIMMPIVGHFTGGVDFSDLKVVLSEAIVAADGTIEKPENAIMWGKWVNALINLIIVGFVLFMIVKAYNKSKKPKEEAPAAPAGPTQEELLMQIRDELRKK
ncbi:MULTISPECIES: large conductance mechanosensitive channel protein MscL [Altibacter]|uniref:large conductance mechanosensitive channel protein MscL n=1 Tax=Altibacter TaxID=1535231 RepID=UPI00054E37CE|nr:MULTISPECIES: large conductance mechanosensitive channel protein MscL [Altibacter]MCW8982096.1 large conductance mechanosensitive channel protein MscL [Altibacter sp.]MCW9036826.1 large conductance mechanosensitive channel protein MscL [Altibacter sp.]